MDMQKGDVYLFFGLRHIITCRTGGLVGKHDTRARATREAKTKIRLKSHYRLYRFQPFALLMLKKKIAALSSEDAFASALNRPFSLGQFVVPLQTT